MALWHRREAEERSLHPVQYPALSSELPLATAPVLEAGQGNAPQIADAYACVNRLASLIASLPVAAWRDTPEGRIPAGASSRIQRLLDHPLPGSTSCDLFSSVMVHLLVTGNCFVGKFRGADGEIVQLQLLDPNSVQVELHGQQIVYRLWLPDQTTTTFGVGDVLHIKAMTGLDGLRGLSPVTQARLALTLDANLQESARQYFANGSKPSGILTLKGPQTEFTVEKVKEQWDERHGGTLNMHRIAVLNGDAAFTPVGFNADDSQFLQQRELSAREVARIFGLPAWAIDAEAPNSRNYQNVSQANLFLVQHSARPWLSRIEKAFTGDADLCMGQLALEFDLDGLLRGDPSLRSDIYVKALDPVKGWMTRAEVRELEGLPVEQIPAGAQAVAQVPPSVPQPDPLVAPNAQ